jgi:predicted deacylase
MIKPQRPAWERSWIEVGAHRDGTAIRVPVARIRGVAGPATLVVAGVHGDEVQGIEAARDLIGSIAPRDVIGTITVIPVANPMAYGAAVRRSPADALDLNRTFPGLADGTPTERLAAALWDLASQSDAIVSLHSWYVFGDVVPYVEFAAGSDGAAVRSRAMARASGLPYNRVSTWHSGLLVATATRHGIPAVEIEIGGLGRVTETGRRQYAAALRGVLAEVGSVPAEAGSSGPHAEPAVVTHRFLVAPAGGFFRRSVALGQTVEPGQPLGEISGLFGDVIATIRSEAPAIVAGIREHPAVQAGDQLLYLFEPVDDTDAAPTGTRRRD